MQSCIYEGRVLHRRRQPVVHRFSFPLFMVYLDLTELPDLFRGSWCWSATRPALAWFRREDHFGDASIPLDRCVRDLVTERTGSEPRGPIRLLTHLRYAGFAMNPVSFFYCFDETGDRIQAVVAEVSNTPWGERHCYVLRADEHTADSPVDARTAKEFHVSPFMAMDLHYAWSIGAPGRNLDIRIGDLTPDGELIFDAVLAMRRQELSVRTRTRALLRYPLLSIQVFASIYWQALRLWLAGTPFYPHPRKVGTPMENLS